MNRDAVRMDPLAGQTRNTIGTVSRELLKAGADGLFWRIANKVATVKYDSAIVLTAATGFIEISKDITEIFTIIAGIALRETLERH